MVVVATSDPSPAQRDGAHLDAVHGLVDELLAPDVGIADRNPASARR
jgi:hypothetical protein